MSRLADIVAEFVVELADPSVTVAIGRKNLHREDIAPRVCFVPIGGAVEMTREIGRQDVSGSDATRQLFQRNLTCEMHLWGHSSDGYTATEQLMHNAIVSLRRAALGSVLFGAESWPSEDEDRAGDVVYGEHAVVEVGLQIPIIDALSALTTGAVTMTHTGIFQLACPLYGWPGLLYGGGSLYGGGLEAVC